MDRSLDDWYDSYLKYIEDTEPPSIFHKWVCVSAIAAALQRKCYLMWDEPTYPNMYIVLVGPPASRKGSALRIAREFLQDINEVKMAKNCSSDRNFVDDMRKAQQTSMDSTGRPIIHSSLTIHSSELSVLFNRINERLLEFLTDLFDCLDKWDYGTANKGEVFIRNTWVNLIGATVPSKLDSNILGAIGSGFTSRVIFVYASSYGKIVTFPWTLLIQEELMQQLKNDLVCINMMAGKFVPDNEFLEFYKHWYPEQVKNPPFSTESLLAYNGRRAKHFLKLCIIFSASRGNSMKITVEDARRALKLLKDTEQNMPRVFESTGKHDMADVLRLVMRDIAVEGSIKRSELLTKHVSNVDNDGLNRIISTIVAMRYAKIQLLQDGDSIITWTGKKKEQP